MIEPQKWRLGIPVIYNSSHQHRYAWPASGGLSQCNQCNHTLGPTLKRVRQPPAAPGVWSYCTHHVVQVKTATAAALVPQRSPALDTWPTRSTNQGSDLSFENNSDDIARHLWPQSFWVPLAAPRPTASQGPHNLFLPWAPHILRPSSRSSECLSPFRWKRELHKLISIGVLQSLGHSLCLHRKHSCIKTLGANWGNGRFVFFFKEFSPLHDCRKENHTLNTIFMQALLMAGYTPCGWFKGRIGNNKCDIWI